MRIAIGIILIFDLGVRFSDYVAFYSDYGVLPREALIMLLNQKDFLSLHLVSGQPYFIAFLFALALWSAIHFLIGKQTRLYTILSWILLLSIQNRNTLIGQGGDDVLRLALMWSIFLPINKYYSLDALRAIKPEKNEYFGWAGVGLTLLIFSLYFFSACMKTAPEWTTDYTAVYYALSLDQIALPLGKSLLQYPFILKIITASVYYIELLGPFLLFIPWKKNLFRTSFVVMFFCFHLGLAFTMFIGFFPAIVMAVLLGFLPTSIMNKIDASISKLTRNVKWTANKHVHMLQGEAIISGWKKHISAAALILIVIHQLAWNFGTVSWIPSKFIPLKTLAFNLRLDQSWGMFAPGVFKEDGWFIFEGITKDNKIIDISRDGKAVRYGKPKLVSAMFKNDRWRKYTENMLLRRLHELRFYYASYLYSRWTEQHPETPIKEIRLIYMKEMTLPDNQFSEPKREVLIDWVHSE
ncbi:MAG: HTTM domain-containing protein [Flavobacteriales bacterium]